MVQVPYIECKIVADACSERRLYQTCDNQPGQFKLSRLGVTRPSLSSYELTPGQWTRGFQDYYEQPVKKIVSYSGNSILRRKKSRGTTDEARMLRSPPDNTQKVPRVRVPLRLETCGNLSFSTTVSMGHSQNTYCSFGDREGDLIVPEVLAQAATRVTTHQNPQTFQHISLHNFEKAKTNKSSGKL
ncbi:hypothetical protein BC827DRAFT_1155881 [Russula dissimulans]|nr:hypothetical protein BC827DRAFT_1155881 [Russula dissimulans]